MREQLLRLFHAPLGDEVGESPAGLFLEQVREIVGREVRGPGGVRERHDDVVVCYRVPERERYRIPERLREGGSLQERTAWASKARSIERAGRTGIQSCSPVGPAGYTGCMQEMLRGAREETTEAIQQKFFQIVRGETPDPYGWLQYVNAPAAAGSAPKGR